MLKKSLSAPTQPRRAGTRLFPRFVLASFRGSTYRSVRLASSLTAASLDSLFEHLPATQTLLSYVLTQQRVEKTGFPQTPYGVLVTSAEYPLRFPPVSTAFKAK